MITDPDDPLASALNGLPKYVASRTLTEVSWNGSTLLTGDVAAEVARLKRQPGRELQVSGSVGLAQTLVEHGLIDEYRLLTAPVVLGKGRRLFAEGTRPVALRAIDHRSTDAGSASTSTSPRASRPSERSDPRSRRSRGHGKTCRANGGASSA
jgi:dihydrofolate reductase